MKTIIAPTPTTHSFASCVLAECPDCNKEVTDLLDIAEYFRKRGMVQNADLIHSAVMRLNLYSGTRLLMRVMGSKGGKKSKRIITPEQQAKMQASRKIASAIRGMATPEKLQQGESDPRD